MREPKACDDCQQLIQYHEGINKVVNMGSGPGGEVGDRHLCPKRVGSKFHHYKPFKPEDIEPEGIYCARCGTRRFRQTWPVCPSCFDLKCDKCGTCFKWKNGASNCPNCGHDGSELIDISASYFPGVTI